MEGWRGKSKKSKQTKIDVSETIVGPPAPSSMMRIWAETIVNFRRLTTPEQQIPTDERKKAFTALNLFRVGFLMSEPRKSSSGRCKTKRPVTDASSLCVFVY